jgi:hypothetical protein
VSFFILATVQTPPPVEPLPPLDTRSFWFESMDGQTVIPVGSETHPGPWHLEVGATGLGVAPTVVDAAGTPGAVGSSVRDVFTLTRDLLLPLGLNTRTQAEQWAAVQELRDLTDPTVGMTPDGNFRLVCSSESGTRQLTLAYLSGLEGEGQELPWRDRTVMSAAAPYPFAEDRAETTREFRLSAGVLPFLDTEGTDNPWGTRQLAPSTVIGEGMDVTMTSAVPVYPTIEITGPVDSVLIESDTGLYINVPGGVDAGDTLRIVTDPRRKSIRLDGALAAGMVARGSRLVPFKAGSNLIDVTAPGATADTRLRLTWRGGYRSLW